MSLDEIYALEHVTVDENENFVYVTPDSSYYLYVEDYPEYKSYYDTLEMLKQSNYSNIEVKPIFDTSIGSVEDFIVSDTSLNIVSDTSLNNVNE